MTGNNPSRAKKCLFLCRNRSHGNGRCFCDGVSGGCLFQGESAEKTHLFYISLRKKILNFWTPHQSKQGSC